MTKLLHEMSPFGFELPINTMSEILDRCYRYAARLACYMYTFHSAFICREARKDEGTKVLRYRMFLKRLSVKSTTDK